MEGARGDFEGLFGSPIDINAIVAERNGEEPSSVPSSPTQAPLLLKPAGGDDWRPLLAEPNPA